MIYKGTIYGKIDGEYIDLSLTTNDIEKAMKQTCEGCIRVTTDKDKIYSIDCLECCRFYGDRYDTVIEERE